MKKPAHSRFWVATALAIHVALWAHADVLAVQIGGITLFHIGRVLLYAATATILDWVYLGSIEGVKGKQ